MSLSALTVGNEEKSGVKQLVAFPRRIAGHLTRENSKNDHLGLSAVEQR
jgi:hypothetical protein